MPRPNILLFLTDDHAPWALGCYGNEEIQTPHLDRLAREGARFANAFTPTPVCSPARACLMTGRTASQVGIHDWLQEGEPKIANGEWLAGEITLPELLGAAGYRCGLAGKWHLGNSHRVPDGFDWCFGMPGWQGEHEGEYTFHLNGEPVELNGNKTSIVTDYALEFLNESPLNRPFFLNVGYIATHSPYHARSHDPAVVALYDDATFSAIPPYTPHPRVKNEGIGNEAKTNEELRPYHAGYYAGVTEIDRNVGRLIAHLEEQGRLDDTLIIYASDHGCAMGQNGFFGKGNSTRPLNMYEVSIRVPVLMRWPDALAEGMVIESCIDHYDTFQTLIEWADAAAPADRAYPGHSYAGLIADPSGPWDDTHFGEYGDLRMVRTPEWKLVRRHGHGQDELFCLPADPEEVVNRIDDPACAEIIADLSQRLDAFYAVFSSPVRSGLRVLELPVHNQYEAWRDGLREK